MPPKRSDQSSAILTKLAFSFEFYDSKEYCLSEWEKEKIRLALVRLGEINSKTLGEIMQQRKTLHFYETDWAKTIKKNGFSRDVPGEPYHFGLPGLNGQKARVYGSVSGSIFYVVWFDFDHEIWPTFKRHT